MVPKRLKAVEREYRVVRIALGRLAVAASHDPDDPRRGAKGPGDRERLRPPGEYLRHEFFAEFETGLRLFWAATCVTPVPDRIVDIVDSIAARQGISDESRVNTHRVRLYRNRLVHQREEEGEVIAIDGARRICACSSARCRQTGEAIEMMD